MFTGPDGLSCVLCDPGSGSDSSFAAGFMMSTQWVPATLSPAGTCSCGPNAAALAANASSAGAVLTAMEGEGGLGLKRCVLCPTGSAPDAAGGSCVPTSGGGPRSAAQDLAYVLTALNARGAGIVPMTATQVGARASAASTNLLPRGVFHRIAMERQRRCDGSVVQAVVTPTRALGARLTCIEFT
jgi:hypothetical protein